MRRIRKHLSSLHRLPQLGYILIVFFEAPGKTMVAVAVADKVVVVGLRRMQGGFERVAAGIADRPGRKSRVSVGVVSGLKLHVGMMQRSGVIPIEQFGIDHAGIGLQRNVPRQTIVVDAGYDGALLRNGSFLLDNRG